MFISQRRAVETRITQEALRRHVLRVLRTWRERYMFSDDYLNGLQVCVWRSWLARMYRLIPMIQDAAYKTRVISDDHVNLTSTGASCVGVRKGNGGGRNV